MKKIILNNSTAVYLTRFGLLKMVEKLGVLMTTPEIKEEQKQVKETHK